MAHMVKVCRWKTGISAEGRSTRRMLHNTLQKWTEILEKHQLSKYDDLLFLYFCVTIFLSVPVITFLIGDLTDQLMTELFRGLFFWSGTDTLKLVSLKEFCSLQTDWLIFIPPPLPRPHLVLWCPLLCLRYKTQTTKDLDQNFRFHISSQILKKTQ